MAKESPKNLLIYYSSDGGVPSLAALNGLQKRDLPRDTESAIILCPEYIKLTPQQSVDLSNVSSPLDAENLITKIRTSTI